MRKICKVVRSVGSVGSVGEMGEGRRRVGGRCECSDSTGVVVRGSGKRTVDFVTVKISVTFFIYIFCQFLLAAAARATPGRVCPPLCPTAPLLLCPCRLVPPPWALQQNVLAVGWPLQQNVLVLGWALQQNVLAGGVALTASAGLRACRPTHTHTWLACRRGTHSECRPFCPSKRG